MAKQAGATPDRPKSTPKKNNAMRNYFLIRLKNMPLAPKNIFQAEIGALHCFFFQS